MFTLSSVAKVRAGWSFELELQERGRVKSEVAVELAMSSSAKGLKDLTVDIIGIRWACDWVGGRMKRRRL